MTKDIVQLIGLAKARVDNGFSQVGKTLKAEDDCARVLMLLASRGIAIGNALVILARHNHANEALPLLRSLFELACAMRWIVQADGDARARAFLEENRNPDWENLWRGDRLKERMTAFEFPREVQERALLSAYDHLFANALGLPWGHVFKDNGHAGLTDDDVLGVASFLLGQVVKSLDRRWPGSFPAGEWEKTRG